MVLGMMPFIHILLLLTAALPLATSYTTLSDDSLRSIPDPGDVFDIKSGSLLSPILIPRVSGSDGSKKVQQHFTDFFTRELPSWDIAYQNSTSKTPATGDDDVPFINMIMTRNPPWASVGEVSYLTLVAHFDSKLTPTDFIGATDSAAPCAMIMHAAKALEQAMTDKWESMQAEGVDEFDQMNGNKGLQVLLLDGEESFVSWTHTDSLYGARSLAEEWEFTAHAAHSTFKTPLQSISLFVLLDLLGAAGPTVPSYFRTTHWAYKAMADVESRLRKAGLFVSGDRGQNFLNEADKKDTDRWSSGMVEDDHLPFMARGVEILHLIPTPFPRVWHTMADDGEHLDIPTVKDWAKLVTAFAAEWMDLEGHLGRRTRRAEKEEL